MAIVAPAWDPKPPGGPERRALAAAAKEKQVNVAGAKRAASLPRSFGSLLLGCLQLPSGSPSERLPALLKDPGLVGPQAGVNHTKIFPLGRVFKIKTEKTSQTINTLT